MSVLFLLGSYQSNALLFGAGTVGAVPIFYTPERSVTTIKTMNILSPRPLVPEGQQQSACIGYKMGRSLGAASVNKFAHVSQSVRL